ncbi:MAG: UDP-2,3-diacylglucosamine diphosphatase LpxI domain-containing protein [Megasphaera lornae]
MPTVGKATVEAMVASGCTVLAMEADKTLFVEQEEVLALAAKHKLCICAVNVSV